MHACGKDRSRFTSEQRNSFSQLKNIHNSTKVKNVESNTSECNNVRSFRRYNFDADALLGLNRLDSKEIQTQITNTYRVRAC